MSIVFNLAYNKNKLYKILDYWSRDMLNSNFLEKGQGQFLHHILYMIFLRKCFSCYILLTDQILLSNCFYFSRYWAICVLQLLVNQALTSQNLKLTLSFWSNRFATWPKSQDKNLNILRMKRTLRWNKKHFSWFLKGFQLPKIVPDLRVHL